MDHDKTLKFFHYCYEGEFESAKDIYYQNVEAIDIRYKKDKIFRFCCQSIIDMDNYNERFILHAKKLLNILKFLCMICNKYKIIIENDKLIDWKVENKKEINIKI
jgi:hypothetical protein